MRPRSPAVAALALLFGVGACMDGGTSPSAEPVGRAAPSVGASVASLPVFGPERFERGTASPIRVSRVLGPDVRSAFASPFTLHVVNGDAARRASSAVVTIDGDVVVRPSDLSPDVPSFVRRVEVSDGSVVSVEVRGIPGSAVTIWIDGVPKETPPTLVSPGPGERILQNNKATGCPPNATYGYGFLINFTWTPAAGPKATAGYELFAGRPGGTPLVQGGVVTGTSYLYATCNFIDYPLVDGWEWRVRARYVDGTSGPWSDTGTFGFTPMPTRVVPLAFVQGPPSYGSGASRVSLSGAVDATTSATVALAVDAYVPLNSANSPFPVVEFFWYDGAALRKAGEAGPPLLFQTPTDRVWRYSFTWDPSAPIPVGAVSVVAVGTDVFGFTTPSTVQTVNVVP